MYERIQCASPAVATAMVEHMLAVDALKINTKNPYVWSSGIKSPLYCDNRRLLSFPKHRVAVKQILVRFAEEYFPQAEAFAGVATAGIPYGIWLADAFQKPFVYVRARAKTHGLQNHIEGHLMPDRRVMVVDDVVSTGKSALHAAAALKAAGQKVLGIATLFTYGLSTLRRALQEKNTMLYTLATYATLLDILQKRELVGTDDMPLFRTLLDA